LSKSVKVSSGIGASTRSTLGGFTEDTSDGPNSTDFGMCRPTTTPPAKAQLMAVSVNTMRQGAPVLAGRCGVADFFFAMVNLTARIL
jgi:hypothetical protein